LIETNMMLLLTHATTKRKEMSLPLEVNTAAFSDAIMNGAHHLDELSFGVIFTDDVVVTEEV